VTGEIVDGTVMDVRSVCVVPLQGDVDPDSYDVGEVTPAGETGDQTETPGEIGENNVPPFIVSVPVPRLVVDLYVYAGWSKGFSVLSASSSIPVRRVDVVDRVRARLLPSTAIASYSLSSVHTESRPFELV